MALIHLPATQHTTLPWKNGLGVSQIMAGDPPGAGYDTLLWQVGVTSFGTDCHFSELTGLDRLFMVIDGDGVELTSIDEGGKTRISQVKAMEAPYAFRGDWKTTCRMLGGQVKVFNVIARRGLVQASVEVAKDRTLNNPAGVTLVAADLKTFDAWQLDGEGTMELPSGAIAVVRIRKA